MRTARRLLVLLLGLALCGPAPLASAAPLPDAAWLALSGKEVELKTADGRLTTGRLLGFDDTHAVVELRSGEVASLRRDEVLDVRIPGTAPDGGEPKSTGEPLSTEEPQSPKQPQGPKPVVEPAGLPPDRAPSGLDNGPVASLVVKTSTGRTSASQAPSLAIEPTLLVEPARCIKYDPPPGAWAAPNNQCETVVAGGLRALLRVTGPLLVRFDLHGGVNHAPNWAVLAQLAPGLGKGKPIPRIGLSMQARLGAGVDLQHDLLRFQATLGVQLESVGLSPRSENLIRAAEFAEGDVLQTTYVGPCLAALLEVGTGPLRGGPLLLLDTRLLSSPRLNRDLYPDPLVLDEARRARRQRTARSLDLMVGGRLTLGEGPVAAVLEVAHKARVTTQTPTAQQEWLQTTGTDRPPSSIEPFSLRLLLGARFEFGP